MQVMPTAITDVMLIVPQKHSDQRGYFVESYHQMQFEAQLGVVDWVQDNESYSTFGVLRGLHYQLPPHAQRKLVRVAYGKVLDVVVDIRRSSPTFGQHVAIELSAENQYQLWIPHGFAHGFVTLSQEAVFQYKVDAYYHPESERGIAFNDMDLGIHWRLDAALLRLSDKDHQQPSWHQAQVFA